MIEPKQITTAAPDWIGPEYATIRAFSQGNRWLILQHSDGFYGLYSGSGAFIRMLRINHSAEPRWDSVDPDVLYYFVGHTFRICNVATSVDGPLHVFSEYVDYDPVERNGVQGLGEGDIEGNRIALAGMLADGRRDVFLFNVSKLTKGGILELEPDASAPLTYKKSGRAHGLDNIYATPGGNVQIGWYASGSERFHGVELYDKDMQFLRQLAPVMGHNDVASFNDRDVLLWCSSADAAINKNAVVMIYQDSGFKVPTPLLELDWKYALHVSCCAKDYVIVSTYAPDNSLPSQIWKVPLNGSSPEALCETRGIYAGYNSTPRASVSRDGSRLVFATNSGIIDHGPDYVETYLEMVDVGPPSPAAPPVPVPPEAQDNPWERIDYAPYFEAGWQYLWEPRADGAIDVYQRKKKGR